MMVAEAKKTAPERATPICPKCGLRAEEKTTKYGIRASCCGLWSWDRYPLVDKATHDARRELGLLYRDLQNAFTATKLVNLLQRQKTGVPLLIMTSPRELNEASCRKMITACENILMDLVAGTVKSDKTSARKGKKFK